MARRSQATGSSRCPPLLCLLISYQRWHSVFVFQRRDRESMDIRFEREKYSSQGRVRILETLFCQRAFVCRWRSGSGKYLPTPIRSTIIYINNNYLCFKLFSKYCAWPIIYFKGLFFCTVWLWHDWFYEKPEL